MVNDSKMQNNVGRQTNEGRQRTIEEAFAELKQARVQYEIENSINGKKPNNTKKKTYDVFYTGSIPTKNKKNNAINQDKLSFKEWVQYRINKLRYDKREIKRLAFITTGVFAVCVMVVSTNYIFAQYTKEEEIKQKIATNVFETNRESLNMQKIVIENVGIKKSKTIVEDEQRDVPYNVERKENPNLPLGEEVLVQEGQFGVKLVDCVKSYENNEYIEEKITNEEVVVQPITEIIDVGTSEFLSTYGVHIGDKMYVTETVNLKEKPSDDAENLCLILESLDVTLESLGGVSEPTTESKTDDTTVATTETTTETADSTGTEESLEEIDLEEAKKWCKVTYENYTGYVKQSQLTSEAVTPGIGELNRKQKIYATLDANMDLTKPSGLTLEDYQKVLSGNPGDLNNIIESNAENFYNAEQKYGVNGLFLASMAIHESAWGTSQIAKDKKNLFGFGAYDRSPYESANLFEDYNDGIEIVAKYLAKNYLNPAGTTIYDEETASGTYFNGPTIAGVNTKYCTDKEWATKIFKYMDYLYSRL